ncbi:MAG: PIN domain-containing protein [Euryarchaeota archaeon]|nr:PIN domain-containing protein [Euryarchaeota archaeon]
MKNTRLKFFIDTTVAISALTGRNTDAWILLESGKREVVSLFVNEFVIKEMRRTLDELQISQENINYAVNYIKECCVVRKNVPKTEFTKYRIRDKNDIPVLAGASHESAVLVTEDSVLKEDAEKYIECATPSDALKKLSNASEKLSA